MKVVKQNMVYKINKLKMGLVLLLIGSLIGYGIAQIHLNANKSITSKLVNNCSEALNTSSQLIANYQQAFDKLATCTVLNKTTCDHLKIADELNQIKAERIKIEDKLKIVTSDVQDIINLIK